MSLAVLMVHLDLNGPNEAPLAVAAGLAESSGATVIGIAACDPQTAPYFYAAYGHQVLEQEWARKERALAALGDHFRKAMGARAKAVEWRAERAAPDPFVARACRAADLVIVGSHDRPGIADPTMDLDVGDLVMRAGRPVLVVPPVAEPLAMQQALVAWKDTPEARRAVAAALPLLRLYRRTVVAAVEEVGPDREAQAGVDAVAEWLGRHGIAAETRVVYGESDAAARLGALTVEHAADLIVAGAYGHSRLSEWVFGGVTRSLLARPPRCLLLAH